MMTLRKISATGDGKLIRAYLTENASLSAKLDDNSPGKVLTKYYGRDARVSWRPDMAPEVAEALGIDLTKRPTEQALDRLFESKRADSGEAWTSNKRDISAYDLTISPEKSVSLAFAFAKTDEEKAAILQSVWRANDRTLRYVGREIGWARRGDGGQDGAEPGKVGWASFMHFSARPTLALQDGPDGQTYVMDVAVPGDPQVHIHNALFNVVVTASGHVGSLDTHGLHGRVKEFGAYFQAFLANELDRLGIRLDYDKGEQAIAISCIPEEVRQAFSKGHAATVRKAKRYAKDQGLDWDALGVERKLTILNNTAAHTRLEKDDGKADARLWQDTAIKIDWAHETAVTGEHREQLAREERIRRATRFAARHVEREFSTAAVLDMSLLRTHAARGLIGVGIESHRDIDAVVKQLERDGIELNGERAALVIGMTGDKLRVTNTVQIELERKMSALVYDASRARLGAVPEAIFRQAVAESEVKFRGDVGRQQLAAAERFAFGGGLVFLEGIAGVGKTRAVLPPAVLAWQRDGRRVIGISQAWRQADALQEAGVCETIAVTPFLESVRSGETKVDHNTVLVIDEAAQLGPRQFLEMMKLWRDTGCIVRGLGDGEQCQAIEASSAIQIMGRNMPEEALPKLLQTVRQKSERAREIAGFFRDGDAETALAMKIEDGHAHLVGGDYEQVVERIARFYVERRDKLREEGNRKGVTVTALTNSDGAAISRSIRGILRDRGEIQRDEILYRAVDNRGEQYELPAAIGDRFRLYKKTAALIDGKRGFIGSNGDIVMVRGWWDKGLVLEDQRGRVGHVEWRRLTDPNTKRLLLGYGHCLTVDAAQGITSGEHINALPRGSAGITAFKGYVAESRHENVCWTLISKGAEIQAELNGRALGSPTEVTDQQIWTRVAKNFADKPYKALAIDLVDRVQHNLDHAVDSFIRTDARLRKARGQGKNLGDAVRAEMQARALQRSLRARVEALRRAVSRQDKILGESHAEVRQALQELRKRLGQELNPRRRGPRRAPAPAPSPF